MLVTGSYGMRNQLSGSSPRHMLFALLGQWIDWDTTDVLMRVRILHGVQNFLAILPESFFIQQHKGISKQSRINGRRGLLTRVCSLWQNSMKEGYPIIRYRFRIKPHDLNKIRVRFPTHSYVSESNAI